MTHTLTLEIAPDLWLSANDRPHWAEKARRTKAVRQLAFVAARNAHIPTLGTTHVAAFIGYPRNGKADPGNAAPTVKAAIDGMVDAGIWLDDDSTYVIGPTYLRGPKPDIPNVHRLRFVLTAQTIPWLETT